MLYSGSLERVDVFRPLGVHMGPSLLNPHWLKCWGDQAEMGGGGGVLSHFSALVTFLRSRAL